MIHILYEHYHIHISIQAKQVCNNQRSIYHIAYIHDHNDVTNLQGLIIEVHIATKDCDELLRQKNENYSTLLNPCRRKKMKSPSLKLFLSSSNSCNWCSGLTVSLVSLPE